MPLDTGIEGQHPDGDGVLVVPDVDHVVELRGDDVGGGGEASYRQLVQDDFVGRAAGAVQDPLAGGAGLQGAVRVEPQRVHVAAGAGTRLGVRGDL